MSRPGSLRASWGLLPRAGPGGTLWLGLLLAVACGPRPSPTPEPGPARTHLQLETVASAGELALYRGLVAAKLGDYTAARDRLGTVAASCPVSPLGSQALLTLVALELDPRNPGRDPDRARSLAERYFADPRKPAWTEPAMESLYLLALELGAATSDSIVSGELDLPRGDSLLAVADSVAAVADSLSAARGAIDSAARAEATPEEAPFDAPADSASSMAEARGDPVAEVPRERTPSVGDTVSRGGVDPRTPLDAEGGLSCASTRPGPYLGELRAPHLPGSPLMERLSALVAERAALRRNTAELERKLAELQQELERIRATLSP